MVKKDALRLVREIVQDCLYSDGFRHHDRNGQFPASLHRRLYKQPFGRADPLVTTSDIVEEGFKLDVVDLALGVFQDANGKASQSLARQMTPMCCEALRVA